MSRPHIVLVTGEGKGKDKGKDKGKEVYCHCKNTQKKKSW